MGLTYVPELSASLSVTNMDASVAWYQKVLGFGLLFRSDEMGWSELSTGIPGVTVGLAQAE